VAESLPATALPTALVPWADGLSVLEPELAMALGPLVRQLDQLVSRQNPGLGNHGPLDGYSGIFRRGDPTRILMSEWALAEEYPLEFLRRATAAELLYLAPAYQQDQSRGRVAVLLDTGPDQLGPGRLVQLAAMIVLNRRATARRSELTIGIVGEPAGQWRTGDIETLLRGWLLARASTHPDATVIDNWLETADHADEVWVIGGPRLARAAPGRRRMLASRECAWDETGATAVEVRLDGQRLELALPRHQLSIRALRGAAFRSAGSNSITTRDGLQLRFPALPAAPLRLLARGEGDSTLVSVPLHLDGRPGRPRRYKFSGPVVAATFVGTRTVAVVAVDGVLRVEVVGKPLAQVDRVSVSLSDLNLDPAALERATETLRPLFFHLGGVIFDTGDGWVELPADGNAPPRSVVAISPGALPDQPRVVWRYNDRTYVDNAPVPGNPFVVLGPNGLWASTQDGIHWELPSPPLIIATEPGERVLGVRIVDDVPALVTVSAAGLIVRLRWPTTTRTLTRWSGAGRPPALHPVHGLLAAQREDGRVEIGELSTGTVLATIWVDG
jgi:hypothetical protein